MLKIVPKYWKIISLSINNDKLFISYIYLNNSNIDICYFERSIMTCLISKFDEILKQNTASTKITNLNEWWNIRCNLDTELKVITFKVFNFQQFLQTIEYEWFGSISNVLFKNNNFYNTKLINQIINDLINSGIFGDINKLKISFDKLFIQVF